MHHIACILGAWLIFNVHQNLHTCYFRKQCIDLYCENLLISRPAGNNRIVLYALIHCYDEGTTARSHVYHNGKIY